MKGLPEQDAQVVLFVAAIEEVDREGVFLDPADRAAATADARQLLSRTRTSVPDEDDERRLLANRARRLVSRLPPSVRGLEAWLRATRVGAGVLPTVLGLALALGLSTNALGPERRLDLLAFPLWGLFVWNLGVYLALVIGALRPRGGSGERVGGPGAMLAGVLAWLAERAQRRIASRSPEQAVLGAACAAFLVQWRRAAGPLLACRVRAILHGGALAATAGTVAGMYVRGLAFEYRAAWESTFLDHAAVDAWLTTLLAPASWASGIGIPLVPELPGVETGAAPWIHLQAVTAVLVVGIPRLLLCLVASVRARRLAADVPIDSGRASLRRVLSADRGGATRVGVVPYSYEPEPRLADALKATLHDVFGARADVVIATGLAYGDEAGALLAASAPHQAPRSGALGQTADTPRGAAVETCRVVLFGLAQSPESEVHGALLDGLRAAAREDRLLVVVDASAYRLRVGSGERVEERRRAWDRVLREAGFTAGHLDLGAGCSDAELTAVSAAVVTGSEATRVAASGSRRPRGAGAGDGSTGTGAGGTGAGG